MLLYTELPLAHEIDGQKRSPKTGYSTRSIISSALRVGKTANFWHPRMLKEESSVILVT
jgi:hypothetical protein